MNRKNIQIIVWVVTIVVWWFEWGKEVTVMSAWLDWFLSLILLFQDERDWWDQKSLCIMPCFSCLDDDFCVVSQPFGCIFVSFMLFRDMMLYSKRSQENVNEPCGDSVSVVVFDSLFRTEPSTRKDDDDEDYIHDFCCCFAFNIERKVEGEKKGPSSSPGPMFAPLTLNKRTYRHRSLFLIHASLSAQALKSHSVKEASREWENQPLKQTKQDGGWEDGRVSPLALPYFPNRPGLAYESWDRHVMVLPRLILFVLSFLFNFPPEHC